MRRTRRRLRRGALLCASGALCMAFQESAVCAADHTTGDGLA